MDLSSRSLPCLHGLLFVLYCFILLTARGDAFTLFLFSTTRGKPTRLSSALAPPDEPWDDGTSDLIATCIPGLSTILAQELVSLGCRAVTPMGSAAVRFQADGPTALCSLLWARTPHKIMESVLESAPVLYTRQDLHQYVYDGVPVQRLLGNGEGGLLSLSVTTVMNAPRHVPADINHSHYTALTIKNTLCDRVRDLRGDRPNVDLVNPDVPLVAVMRGDAATGGAQLSLYRQVHSQGSLHKRGYRAGTAIHKAALKESLAAGLLYQAGWHDTCRQAQRDGRPLPLLLDPMAGSGTLILEGLCMAADVAPHLLRIKTSMGADAAAAAHQIPPMLRWKEYADLRRDVWPDLLRQATQRAKTGIQWLQTNHGNGPRVYVNDLHTGALALLDESLHMAGLPAGLVDITAGDCADWKPSILHHDDASNDEPWTVVCNPPWGVRLEENVDDSWQALSHFLKQTCPAGRTKAHVLSGNAKATKQLGLRRSQSMPIKVGTQDLRWLQYELHGPDYYRHRETTFDDGDDDDSAPAKPNARPSVQRISDSFPDSSTFRARQQRPRSADGNRRQEQQPRGRPGAAADTKKKSRKTTRVATTKANEWLLD